MAELKTFRFEYGVEGHFFDPTNPEVQVEAASLEEAEPLARIKFEEALKTYGDRWEYVSEGLDGVPKWRFVDRGNPKGTLYKGREVKPFKPRSIKPLTAKEREDIEAFTKFISPVITQVIQDAPSIKELFETQPMSGKSNICIPLEIIHKVHYGTERPQD